MTEKQKNRMNELLDQMRKLSSLIMKAKIEGKSTALMRSQFGKLQMEHKKLWKIG